MRAEKEILHHPARPDGSCTLDDCSYGYLEIYSFAFDGTVLDELAARLPELLAFRGLVVDMRANSGGNDAHAAKLAAIFTSKCHDLPTLNTNRRDLTFSYTGGRRSSKFTCL